MTTEWCSLSDPEMTVREAYNQWHAEQFDALIARASPTGWEATAMFWNGEEDPGAHP